MTVILPTNTPGETLYVATIDHRDLVLIWDALKSRARMYDTIFRGNSELRDVAAHARSYQRTIELSDLFDPALIRSRALKDTKEEEP